MNGVNDDNDLKNLDFKDMESMNRLKYSLAIASLLGVCSNLDKVDTPVEFEEMTEEEQYILFSLPFDEAIAYLMMLYPMLEPMVEPILAGTSDYINNVAELTELQIEKKALEYKAENPEVEYGTEFTDGVAESLSAYPTVVFATNLGNAYSRGSYYGIKLNPEITYAVYNAVIDHKTTDLCLDLDREIAPLEEWESRGLVPPNHFNCRSRIEGLTEAQAKAQGFDTVDLQYDETQLPESFKGNSYDELDKIIEKRRKEVEELKSNM